MPTEQQLIADFNEITENAIKLNNEMAQFGKLHHLSESEKRFKEELEGLIRDMKKALGK